MGDPLKTEPVSNMNSSKNFPGLDVLHTKSNKGKRGRPKGSKNKKDTTRKKVKFEQETIIEINQFPDLGQLRIKSREKEKGRPKGSKNKKGLKSSHHTIETEIEVKTEPGEIVDKEVVEPGEVIDLPPEIENSLLACEIQDCRKKYKFAKKLMKHIRSEHAKNSMRKKHW